MGGKFHIDSLLSETELYKTILRNSNLLMCLALSHNYASISFVKIATSDALAIKH